MEEREPKNKFWKGVLIGALVTALFGLILVGMAAGIWVVLNTVSLKQAAANRQESQTAENAGQDGHALDMAKIGPKLLQMQNLIDKYYLFEEDDYSESAEDWIYSGFVYSLNDPYSVYYSAEDYKSLSEENEGEYYGIGVQVSQNMATGIITVVKVFKDTPAEEAGLLPGDILFAVGDMEVTGMDLSLLVNDYIKGEEGTTVDLTVYRDSSDEYVDLTVGRRLVENPTVEWKMLEDKIGYISLSSFEEVSSPQFVEAYNSLESRGMRGLVFDLRNNGGGVIVAAEDIADYLLPQDDVIVSFKGKSIPETVYRSDDGHESDIPIAVLVNGESASSSEVLTGALKDNDRAIIVGTKTFGKGIAQGIFPLPDGSALKLTTSYYYTPSGECIHETGIEPDVEVELDEGLRQMIEIPVDEDNQLAVAVTAVKEGIGAAKAEAAEHEAKKAASGEAEAVTEKEAAEVAGAADEPAADEKAGDTAGKSEADGKTGETTGEPETDGKAGESVGKPATDGKTGETAGEPEAGGKAGEPVGKPAADGKTGETAGEPAAGGATGEPGGKTE